MRKIIINKMKTLKQYILESQQKIRIGSDNL